MGEASSFIGRFHPLIVHFPIGILWLAFFLEILSRFKKYKKVRFAVQPALILGAIGAVFSTFTGYLLSQEGGYEERILHNHQWLGIATAVFSFLTYAFHQWTFLFKEKQRKTIRVIIFIPLLILLIITGHLGGSLTHGEDFLSPSSRNQEKISKTVSFSNDSNFYKHFVKPVLEKNCYSCHNAKKQKGQLRLDKVEFMLAGGKHGKVLKASLPGESELIKRLMLPITDEQHMPPKGKQQLTNVEIDLLYGWIEEGASFEKKIGEFVNQKIVSYKKSLTQVASTLIIDDTDTPELDQILIDELRTRGIIIVPLSQNSKFVKAFCVNPTLISDKEVELLKPFKKQLIDIKLSKTGISNEALNAVGTFVNLRSLALDNTNISDEGIKKLKDLQKLERINLVSTEITDKGLVSLASVGSLKEVYVYNTKITKQSILDFYKISRGVAVDTGKYMLIRLLSDTIVFSRKD